MKRLLFCCLTGIARHMKHDTAATAALGRCIAAVLVLRLLALAV